MTKESQAIEVEVLEIDGAAPVPIAETRQDESRPWRNWQGRVRTLDRRWWPLWLLLGAIAIALLLTVGVVIAVVFVLFRILNNLVRGIADLFAPERSRSIR